MKLNQTPVNGVKVVCTGGEMVKAWNDMVAALGLTCKKEEKGLSTGLNDTYSRWTAVARIRRCQEGALIADGRPSAGGLREATMSLFYLILPPRCYTQSCRHPVARVTLCLKRIGAYGSALANEGRSALTCILLFSNSTPIRLKPETLITKGL